MSQIFRLPVVVIPTDRTIILGVVFIRHWNVKASCKPTQSHRLQGLQILLALINILRIDRRLVLLHESSRWLRDAEQSIIDYLPRLGLALNPRKTVRQPINRGIDFAGYVIKPWRTEVRRRTVRSALSSIEALPEGETLETINSYLGLMRHANAYHDRAGIANAARKRGHCVDVGLNKAFRRA